MSQPDKSGNAASNPEKCDEEAAGYDGMFGVYCSLPKGHEGPHNDGHVEWDFVDPRWRNSKTPAQVAEADLPRWEAEPNA